MVHVTKSLLTLLALLNASPVSAAQTSQPSYTAGPRYPYYAAKHHIEGYVKLSFDINAEGNPVNIKVLEAKPEGIFEKSAVYSLSQWHYKPVLKDGKAVERKEQVVQLDFKLGK